MHHLKLYLFCLFHSDRWVDPFVFRPSGRSGGSFLPLRSDPSERSYTQMLAALSWPSWSLGRPAFEGFFTARAVLADMGALLRRSTPGWSVLESIHRVQLQVDRVQQLGGWSMGPVHRNCHALRKTEPNVVANDWKIGRSETTSTPWNLHQIPSSPENEKLTS